MKNSPTATKDAVVITAVLPPYREAFLRALKAENGSIAFYAGSAQKDSSVVTGVSASLYTEVRTIFLLGRRVFWHRSVIFVGLRAPTLVVDLNPRSITSWFFLVARRCTRRRVLIWGHVDPRRGASSSTAPIRRLMRRLADGVITYTWTDRRRVMNEDATDAVWVAPNALYPREHLAAVNNFSARRNILYVGRLVPEKKVELLLEAFALVVDKLPNTSLLFVGEGSSRSDLDTLRMTLGLAERVNLLGSVTAVEDLRDLYSSTMVSISPGYVGLSLTQSLGFGVPMIYADDEAHAPEIELIATGAALPFTSGSVQSLSRAILDVHEHQEEWRDRARAASIEVADLYSANAMASGFCSAVDGELLETPAIAWLR
jgi:glycosyltransferase involved in cell wall biosynthesis